LLFDFQGVSYGAEALNSLRWVALGFSVLTAVAAIVAILLRNAEHGEFRTLSYCGILGFRISDAFGKGELLFAPPALFSIIGFYQHSPAQQMWLLFLWAALVYMKPFELGAKLITLVASISRGRMDTEVIGTLSRIDNPDIVRVSLKKEATWNQSKIVLACLPNLEQVRVLPLFSHVQEAALLGTGLICSGAVDVLPGALAGNVYSVESDIDPGDVIRSLSGAESAELVGFVVEESSIEQIRVEVSPSASLEEGMLLFCNLGGQAVYYQVLDARTTEETFAANPRGKHVALAAQLGSIDQERGFVKYGWLPKMNTPVFTAGDSLALIKDEPMDDEFVFGLIPGSKTAVKISVPDLIEYHAAILGVTGTGKTEVAFDMIREAVKRGTKVFCVDFTGEYKARLVESQPEMLGLDSGQASELDSKLFAVETGEYGAPREKGALQQFVDEIREPVKENVGEFLASRDARLGIFELPEITNTKATLLATELYLSSIMAWAKENRRARQVLIVLEEAHTIIPETAWMGFDDYTRRIVGRISQIALQGRKYGVGLLLISQRTALVSKSILSQCNTYVTFSLVDKTSLDYLANVYSLEHVRSIPNLRFLEALVYGKAVRSERPMIAKIVFDPEEKRASEGLRECFEEVADNEAVETSGGFGKPDGKTPRVGDTVSPADNEEV